MHVGEETSLRKMAAAADSNHPVSGMVMCAAVFEEIGRAEDASIDVLDAVFRIGYRGTFLSNRVFARRMAGRSGGAIVNLSSFGGLISSPSYSYGPMKAALVRLTKNMAVEWGRSGVRINVASLGVTLVPRVVERLKKASRYTANAEQFSALGRFVTPEEVGEAIAFLLSDAAAGITGVDLPVDAGMVPGLNWSLFGGVPPARTAARSRERSH